MPPKLWPILLVALLLLLALLRGRQLAHFLPTEASFDSEALAAAWSPSRECELIPVESIQAGDWSLPAGEDDYLLGLEALSAAEVDEGRQFLNRAVEAENHVLALALLANMQLQSGQSLPDDVDDIGPVTGEQGEVMQLALARYYLGIAARCDAQGEAAAARRYLSIGESLLPPEAATRLDLYLARRIGEIHLADGQWEQALPWLRRASEANDSALLLLAEALQRAGLREEALAAYQRTLLYYPERIENRLAGAQTAADLGEIELAITMLTGMPRWEDLGPSGLLLWAELCEQQADRACAILQYERVLSLEPDNLTALSRLQTLNSEQ